MDTDASEGEECAPEPSNAFDVLMARKKPKVAESEPSMIAVIYIRWLKWIDPLEVLYGCPYVGQAVRALSTAELVAVARWKEENNEAMRESKRIGLLHELKMHGPGVFYNEIVEWKQGPRSEVQKWANEREIALIAEHGGPLQNPSMRCKQTLNLTNGGERNVNFEARDALRTVVWLLFHDEMEEYVECHDTALVPHLYTNPMSGYKLGRQLNAVRQGALWRGHRDHAKRIEWLEALPGWAWKAKETDEFREAVSERNKKRFEAQEEREAASRRGKSQWANADEETRAEWCRNQSEGMNRPEVKAVRSYNTKKRWVDADEETRAELRRKNSESHNRPEVKAASSERAKAQAAREAAEGKKSLGERGKATSTTNWTQEQREAALAKQVATNAAKRAAVLATLPESERPKKQAEFDRADRKEANRRAKANALLELPSYADKGYQLCYRTLAQAAKDGVVFFQDEHEEWCARMGTQGGAGSSAEHANAPVVKAAAPVAAAAKVAPAQKQRKHSLKWCVLADGASAEATHDGA